VNPERELARPFNECKPQEGEREAIPCKPLNFIIFRFCLSITAMI
jgi:hypothetical protein